MFPLPLPRLRGLVLTATFCVAALAAGCAHSEYDLVQPADLSRHIGTKTTTVPWPPLEYRFTSVEDHLVVRIYNRTNEPIQLLGAQSVVVDPKGQSHVIGSRIIAPQSYIKMVLPPLRAIVGPVGPTVGFGFGFGGGYWRRGFGYRYGYFYDDPLWYGPSYYEVYDDGQGSYWYWPDNGSVRLVLVYQRGVRPPGPGLPPATGAPGGAPPGAPEPATAPGVPPAAGTPETFTHDFVFRQRKV